MNQIIEQLIEHAYSAATRNGTEIRDGKEDDYAWLAEMGTPDNLYMRQGVYTGPAVNVQLLLLSEIHAYIKFICL